MLKKRKTLVLLKTKKSHSCALISYYKTDKIYFFVIFYLINAAAINSRNNGCALCGLDKNSG